MKIQPRSGWRSLWRHFFDRERTVADLTHSMIQWQERWNWDFLKINPPACYHALDWGAEYEFFPDPLREPKLQRPRIHSAQDVPGIVPPLQGSGVLGEQVQTIRNLRAHFGPDLPMVHTVFSPIEIAHRLMTGRPLLLEMMRNAPGALLELLRKITDAFLPFCLDCLDAGADGIFFATKWASHKHMTWAEYERFGKPWEMEILDALRGRDAWVILHVCGEDTYLEQMLDYRVDVFSYDFFAPGAVPPQSVAQRTGKHVLGGIDPELLLSDPDGAARQALQFASLDGWIAGPSCVVPPRVPESAVEQLQKRLLRSIQ